MTPFKLKIITPYGVFFDDETTNVIVKTTVGDMAVLHGRAPYAAALSVGKIRIMIDGKYKYASTSGGLIRASKSETQIIVNTCEWADKIDIHRAEYAKKVAEERKASAQNRKDIMIAEYKLLKAINRIDTANFK